MFRIKQRSSLVRSLATAAAAVAIAAVSAGPASAWQVDHPKVVGPNIDFGSNWSGALGAPLAGGNLRWDTTGGTVTPKLSGRLFMNNVNGLRGRLRIDYYDAAQNRIALRHSTWRTAGVGFNAFDFVDFAPFGATNVYGVEVKTQIEDAAGVIHTVGSVVETI
jgi:hypothetical protein